MDTNNALGDVRLAWDCIVLLGEQEAGVEGSSTSSPLLVNYGTQYFPQQKSDCFFGYLNNDIMKTEYLASMGQYSLKRARRLVDTYMSVRNSMPCLLSSLLNFNTRHSIGTKVFPYY